MRPVPSLLRGFSAPVKLISSEADDDLCFRLAYDSDDFNRWDAGQTLQIRTLLGLIDAHRQGRAWSLPDWFSVPFERALASDVDQALIAQILTLPSQTYLAEQLEVVDVEGIHAAHEYVRRTLAERLREQFLAVYKDLHRQDQAIYRMEATARGARALKNVCLDYLMQIEEGQPQRLCLEQFYSACNMTDQIGALAPLAHFDGPERLEALASFYQRWHHEPLVVDKWFTLQATSSLPDTLETVRALLNHEAFTLKNPNKVRALIGTFAQANPLHFHRADGSGYAFVTDQILALNAFNPQIAARLITAFTRWRKFDSIRQQQICQQLERILATAALSPDVYEIAAKSLENE
jgi:aminopeptidase N